MGGIFQILLTSTPGCGKEVSVKNPFLEAIRFRVELGDNIFFWHNSWTSDRLLVVQILDLYKCARYCKAMVSNYLDHDATQICWSSMFKEKLE